MRPKFAPANEAGEKPFIVTIWEWGKQRVKVIYASDAREARYLALPRKGNYEYILGCRRATTADVGEDA